MKDRFLVTALLMILPAACGENAPIPQTPGSEPEGSAPPTASAPELADTALSVGPAFPVPTDSAREPADPSPNTPPSPPSPADIENPAGWTVGIVDRRKEVPGAALLRVVRAAPNAEFERVVFEFEGDIIPSYHVEYVDRPVRQCGSGEVVPVEGDAWLAVRMDPANAHTEQGQPTVRDRSVLTGLPLLRQLEMTCDFEAQVEWVLGLSSPNRYRVLELRDPARLVVDIAR